jgi:hypothetical protein
MGALIITDDGVVMPELQHLSAGIARRGFHLAGM